MIPIITIEGATASGKSAFAVALAQHLRAEIISADSRQVYRFMDIGTAKASPEERKGIAHHLIDIIDPDKSYNAGSFMKDAAAIIETLHSRQVIPILCGGTGLYVRSLLLGLCDLPQIPDYVRSELKERLQQTGLEAMYMELKGMDPDFAGSISINDVQRILRGLEVAIGTGKTITEHWQAQNSEPAYLPYRIFLDLPRSSLYARINSRMEQMVELGLVDEIRQLYTRGYSEASPGLNSLGYKEFIPLIHGQASAENCTTLAAQHHRNYAKRQLTWYRKCRFDLTFNPDEVNLSEIIEIVEEKFTEAVNANCSQSNRI